MASNGTSAAGRRRRVPADLPSYPGGKGGAGVFQTHINNIPPHDVFISGFAGHCTVLRTKRPARRSIAVDLDPAPLAQLSTAGLPSLEAVQADALDFLAGFPWQGGEFVYLDPPYLLDLRTGPLYAHELTHEDHRRLLALVRRIPAPVMLCGYPSELYDGELRGWRVLDVPNPTRGGWKLERLWMNYPEPGELHDYRFLGRDYRERQDVRRMRERWLARLRSLPAVKRYALLSALEELRQPGGTGTGAAGDVGRGGSAGGAGGIDRSPAGPAL